MASKSLFDRLFGPSEPEDPELLKLKADRPSFGDGQPVSKFLRVARRLAKLGRHAEAIEQIVDLLWRVEEWVQTEFPQCSKSEKRDMRAMFRHDIYKGLARCQPPDRGAAAAYCRLIAHAWWCIGLRLQIRKEELARDIQEDAWRQALGKYERGDAALAVCKRFRARNESDVDELREQLITVLEIEAPKGY